MMENLRPCIITDEKIKREGRKITSENIERRGYFHRWEELSRIVPPSLEVGGHSGGVEKFTLAIIEFEDGTVERVPPYKIKFTDRGNGKNDD